MTSKIASKSGLAVVLSRLSVFQRPKVRVEQYPTDSEIAAEVLWSAFMKGDMDNKVIADLGCGTGILGIGAILLGAKKVFLIDIDKEALQIAKNNILYMESEGYLENIKEGRDFVLKCTDIEDAEGFIEKEITEGNLSKIDTVLQNPPFGTRIKHMDRVFLEAATNLARVTYTFHKSSTENFVKAFCDDAKVRITDIWRFDFPLKKSLEHHRKKIQKIEVSCFRLEKA